MNLENELRSIIAIDKTITIELAKLKSIVENLNFEELPEFTLDENTEVICDENFNFKGIYLFEIKNTELNPDARVWMAAFKTLWRHPDYDRKFTPGIKAIRTKTHSLINEWVPLYIGKSRNVGNRINEHIIKELTKTTFAMKLKARKNLYGSIFRVKILKMDVENYDVIVPFLESVLRDKLNPIVGKQ